jgi:hypothetical protein
MTLNSRGVLSLLRKRKLTALLLFIPFIIFGQQLDVVSVFPLQNDNTVSANTEIRVDFNIPIDTTGIGNQFVVMGDMNGLYPANVSVNPSLQSVVLQPAASFLIGEKVNVTVRSTLTGSGGESFTGFNWRFTIKPTKITPPYFSQPRVFNVFSGSYYTTMFPADVNNDNHIDIVILSAPIQIAVNDGLGNFTLAQQLPNYPENPDIQITDLDLDGFKEIICTEGIYEADPTGIFQFVQPISNWVYDVADMNRDGYPDLIMGYFIGISYNDGAGHFNEVDTILTDGSIVDAVTGDFNNDGIIDIAYGTVPDGSVGTNSVKVVFMDSSGDSLYRSIHPSSSPFHILSLDVNNDNFLDVFNSAALSDSYFILNNQQGGFIDSAIVVAPGGDSYSWSFFGDITGDGWLDQLYIQQAFFLDGGVCRYNINMGGSFGSFWGEDLEERNNVLPFSVTAGDFNGDGSLDAAILWNDGLRIFLNDDDVFIPPNHQNIPQQFAVYQNYPNPFNGETRLQFYLPQPSEVESIIYDIPGKEVAKYYPQNYPKGRNTIKWDSKDSHGKEVSSGIYIWELKTQGLEECIKIMLIR